MPQKCPLSFRDAGYLLAPRPGNVAETSSPSTKYEKCKDSLKETEDVFIGLLVFVLLSINTESFKFMMGQVLKDSKRITKCANEECRTLN